jgi:hypothetical protein
LKVQAVDFIILSGPASTEDSEAIFTEFSEASQSYLRVQSVDFLILSEPESTEDSEVLFAKFSEASQSFLRDQISCR